MGSPFGEEYILVSAYDRPFRLETGEGRQISSAAITRGLIVETSGAGTAASEQISPLAAARYSYTILPR
jgi:hypothetical protein